MPPRCVFAWFQAFTNETSAFAIHQVCEIAQVSFTSKAYLYLEDLFCLSGVACSCFARPSLAIGRALVEACAITRFTTQLGWSPLKAANRHGFSARLHKQVEAACSLEALPRLLVLFSDLLCLVFWTLLRDRIQFALSAGPKSEVKQARPLNPTV